MHFDRSGPVRLPQVGPIPSAAATTRCFTSRVDVPVGLVVCKEACLLGMQSNTLSVPAQLPIGRFQDLQQDANHLPPARRLRSKLYGETLWVEHPVGWDSPNFFSAA